MFAVYILLVSIFQLWFNEYFCALPDKTDSAFLNDCFTAHNNKRALHQNTPPLSRDSSLEAFAKLRCYNVSSYYQLQENHKGARAGTGENLFWGANTGSTPRTCTEAVQLWYNEIANYNYSNPGPDQKGVTGHFTQLIWKNTTRFGCARSFGFNATLPSFNQTYICCEYEPPGNVIKTGDRPFYYKLYVLPTIAAG